MTPEQNQVLRSKPAYRSLSPVVDQLVSKGKGLDDAWLLAGALYAYTGILQIPNDIVEAAGKEKSDYPKVVGAINNFLRGKRTGGTPEQFQNLLELLGDMELLPEWNSGRNDPTRMMDAYEGIDDDYRVGNILLMAEVGSVSRNRPAPGLYDKQYRIHLRGGLKDISAINPTQQEVIYAPGTAYLVLSRETGKVKAKKGNQAHIHVNLEYVSKNSRGYKEKRRQGLVIDLRDPDRHRVAIGIGAI